MIFAVRHIVCVLLVFVGVMPIGSSYAGETEAFWEPGFRYCSELRASGWRPVHPSDDSDVTALEFPIPGQGVMCAAKKDYPTADKTSVSSLRYVSAARGLAWVSILLKVGHAEQQSSMLRELSAIGEGVASRLKRPLPSTVLSAIAEGREISVVDQGLQFSLSRSDRSEILRYQPDLNPATVPVLELELEVQPFNPEDD